MRFFIPVLVGVVVVLLVISASCKECSSRKATLLSATTLILSVPICGFLLFDSFRQEIARHVVSKALQPLPHKSTAERRRGITRSVRILSSKRGGADELASRVESMLLQKALTDEEVNQLEKLYDPYETGVDAYSVAQLKGMNEFLSPHKRLPSGW